MWRASLGSVVGAILLSLACGKSERDDDPITGPGGTSSGAGAAATSAGNASAGSSAASGGAPQPHTAGAPSVGGHPIEAGAPSDGGQASNAGAPSDGGQASNAGAPSDGGQASCDGSYIECGCGCCITQAASTSCFYPDRGESLEAIIAADAARSSSPTCASADCSAGVLRVCCAALPPEVDEKATYSASVYIGGVNRLRITKMTSTCTWLSLQQPASASTPSPLELPSGWELDQATRHPCAASSTPPRAIGALGSLALRVSGDECVLDAHLTLFFTDSNNGVVRERLDVDGLPVDGLSLHACQ
jgi:hypothetical protein